MGRPGKQRILFVAFQTLNRANGGLESMSEIVNGLGHWEKYMITQRRTQRLEQWKNFSRIVILRYVMKLPKVFSIPVSNIFVLIFCIQHRIRVVYCNDIDALVYVGPLIRMAGVRITFSIRGVKTPDEKYGIKWKLSKWITNAFIVLSYDMKDILSARLGIDRSKVFAIYSIVNGEKYKPYDSPGKDSLRKSHNIMRDKTVIGIPAAVYPLKQQYEFITQSCAAILEKLPAAVFYFIGDFDRKDPYCRKCLQATIDLGIDDRVFFAGYSSQMADWYNIFDLTLVVSKREGLSRVMIESLSCGTPVISFDVCSAREILEKHDCGRVVSNGDFDQLTSEITGLVNFSDYQQYVENGIALREKLFSSDLNLAKFEKVLRP